MTRRLYPTLLLICALGLSGCAEEPAPAAWRLEPVVAGGSPFHGVHGLRFGADGTLYATSVIGQSIFAVDVTTGTVETFVGPREGMADDLAIGPDGTFVWTAIEDGIVYARSPAGEIRRLVTDRKGVNAVSFSPDGDRLFATLVFYGDALYELDIAGAREPRLIRENLGGLNAFEVGEDGMIYGPLSFGARVVRIDPDTGDMTTVSDAFESTGALKLDSRGGAYVLDTAARALKRVDLASGTTTTVAPLPFGADNLALDANGQVFVSLSEVNAILAVDPATGASRYIVEPAPLTSATGLAVTTEGGVDTLHIGDLFGGVKRIEAASGRLTQTPIDVFQPAHVSATDDHLLVVSEVFGAIQQVNRRTYAKTAEWTDFTAPGDALEAPDGTLVVAETGTGRVLRVRGPAVAERDVVADGLRGPRGLAWADADRTSVYVTEAGGGRLLRLTLDTGTQTVVAEGLRQPEGVALLPDGGIAVMEVAARRLTRVAPDGTTAELAGALPVGHANGPSLFRSLAVSPAAIYFNSDVENAVYRLTPP